VILEVRGDGGIELALEGFRFYDIVRWRRGELMEMPWTGIYVPQANVDMDLNEDAAPDVHFFTVEPTSFYPIPESHLLTNPALQQNPGW
jgi:hypothetical protein